MRLATIPEDTDQCTNEIPSRLSTKEENALLEIPNLLHTMGKDLQPWCLKILGRPTTSQEIHERLGFLLSYICEQEGEEHSIISVLQKIREKIPVSLLAQEEKRITKEDLHVQFAKELSHGEHPDGVYCRAIMRINEHLYKILEKISYPKLNIQKLCRERSDLDDVYVTALFEYCLFKNTGKRLEEVGCIIANGGNGGMRIFPQSDKDYEFLPKPEAEGGLNEKTLARVKEDMDALSSTFFTLRIGETPQEMMIHANAEFAKVLQELRMVESDGDAFRYSIRAIEAIAKQHGIILEITEQEKVGHFLSHLLDALEVSGLPIQPEQREQTIKPNPRANARGFRRVQASLVQNLLLLDSEYTSE